MVVALVRKNVLRVIGVIMVSPFLFLNGSHSLSTAVASTTVMRMRHIRLCPVAADCAQPLWQ